MATSTAHGSGPTPTDTSAHTTRLLLAAPSPSPFPNPEMDVADSETTHDQPQAAEAADANTAAEAAAPEAASDAGDASTAAPEDRDDATDAAQATSEPDEDAHASEDDAPEAIEADADTPEADAGEADEAVAEAAEAAETAPEAAEAVAEAAEAAPEATPEADAAHKEPEADDTTPASPFDRPLAQLPPSGPSDAARLSQLRAELDALAQDASPADAVAQLAARLDNTTPSRRLPERLLLHRTCGQLALAASQGDVALTHLQAAFRLDPRDRVVLTLLGDLLAQTGYDADLLLNVDQTLLLHHRRSLSPPELASAYRRIGQWHLNDSNIPRARSCLQRSLRAQGGDLRTMELLIEVVEAEGDPQAVVDARTQLLDHVQDPAGRAKIRVAIGDDYLHKLNDPERALEAFEAAYAEHPSTDALKRIADLALDQENWKRAADITVQLAEQLPSTDDRVNAHLQAAALFRDKLWNTARAAQSFNAALDLQPARIEIFSDLVLLHTDAQQWPDLQRAYTRMIQRAQASPEPNPTLLFKLHLKLGNLYREFLDDRPAAIEAYQAALTWNDGDLDTLNALTDLYTKAPDDDTDSLQKAIELRYALLKHGADQVQTLDAIARLKLRLQEFDEAFCVFRALDYLGHADDKAQAFVANNIDPAFTPLRMRLTKPIYRKFLLGDDFDRNLAEIFELCKEPLFKLLAHDLDFYDLSNKHRIDRRQGLMFNNIYQAVARTLDMREPPPVYEKDGFAGLMNASLYPPGLIVGSNLLSGASENEIAFIIGKELALFQDQSFLVQLRPLRDLMVIFYTLVKLCQPEQNIPFNEAMKKMASAIKKLKDSELKRLNVLVSQVIVELRDSGEKLDARIRRFQTSVEDGANRAGLLFCDDLRACRAMIERQPNPIDRERSVDDRMNSLVQWTLSADYLDLRRRLGLKIG